MMGLAKGKAYNIDILNSFELPMAGLVKCGFPSPAQDYMQEPVDLNDLIVKNKTATFIFVAEGNSMERRHIPDGSLLVVDRSVNPKHKDIILASVDGEFTVKTLDKKMMALMPAHPEFEPIPWKEGMELLVWGVITFIIINPYK